MTPLLGAALIAISRCEDYRHDVYDVTVGSLLGISIAYFSYRRYYPPLRSSTCDVPYPSRAEVSRAGDIQSSKRDQNGDPSALYVLDDADEDEVMPLRAIRNGDDRDLERGMG